MLSEGELRNAQMTTGPTFVKFQEESSATRIGHKFSNVCSIVILYSKLSNALTFEKFYQLVPDAKHRHRHAHTDADAETDADIDRH